MSTPVQPSLREPSAAPPGVSSDSLAADPRPGPADAGPVVVRRNRRFEGLLTFRGRAQIDGELRGEVQCRGTLRLGPEAVVQGNIDADELIIGGRLRGDATARLRIELCGTARVEGTIRAPRVALAEGCLLDGSCETIPPLAESEAGSGAFEAS